MADIEINTHQGSIAVTLSMKGALGGNEMLAEAKAKAKVIADASGKEANLESYGVKRDGEDITITFALKG